MSAQSTCLPEPEGVTLHFTRICSQRRWVSPKPSTPRLGQSFSTGGGLAEKKGTNRSSTSGISDQPDGMQTGRRLVLYQRGVVFAGSMWVSVAQGGTTAPIGPFGPFGWSTTCHRPHVKRSGSAGLRRAAASVAIPKVEGQQTFAQASGWQGDRLNLMSDVCHVEGSWNQTAFSVLGGIPGRSFDASPWVPSERL